MESRVDFLDQELASAQVLYPVGSFSSGPVLDESDVHVWAALLAQSLRSLPALATLLSAFEREQAAKFRLEPHRNRFIAARGLLRNLLGCYLGMDPAGIEFGYGPQGKPFLAGELGDREIHFNIAHSENLALFAFSRRARVGVDVERIQPIKDTAQLVARFCTARETARFRELSPIDQVAAFFKLWTRKEAFLKATGEGITASLSQIEVSFLPSDPARLLALGGDVASAACWSLIDLSVASGWASALAIPAPAPKITCWQWKCPGQWYSCSVLTP
jgi:4'-phosphopantetheinyl transferase